MGKYRLIHDLSHPYNGVSAVNDCILLEHSKVTYSSIKDIIQMALEIRPTAMGTHLDIQSAFLNLPMLFAMLTYLEFTLIGFHYVITSLPFGAASSCLIFEKFAILPKWIIHNETRRCHMSHCLDDFPLLGTCTADTQAFTGKFMAIMHQIGMPIAEKMIIPMTQCLMYLGLLLDFVTKCWPFLRINGSTA